MADIQVDMYEVQLGAAVLIQFKHAGQTVRVLADAGVHAGGYSRDHVLQKLKPSFQAFDSAADDRINLLMGTHYDKDHLDGLIDVAADTSIKITEAWLPPVEDDTDDVTDGSAPSLSLGAKFAADDGDAVFEHYIERQREICMESLDVRNRLQSGLPQVHRAGAMRPMAKPTIPAWQPAMERDALEEYFAAHVEDADEDLPESHGARQADDDVEEVEDLLPEMDVVGVMGAMDTMGAAPAALRSLRPGAIPDNLDLSDVMSTDSELGANMMTRAAVIRKSAARNAINASSLKKLVEQLNARNIPIRFEQIRQGRPKYCVLNASGQFRRKSKSRYDASDRPKLTLLGPSDALIKKHKKILPIFHASMTMTARIPIKSVTPSNQLSYVAKFEHSDQSILISGDTGFVDFKPSGRNKPYFQRMLDELDLIDVVQVAHHAGNNAHFYRVLQEAPFGSRAGSAPYFLISHATHDKHRPSAVFESFVANLQAAGPIPELLFTSEPKSEKVSNFVDLVAPVVGTQSTVGDVKLTFDGTDWSLDAHSIKV